MSRRQRPAWWLLLAMALVLCRLGPGIAGDPLDDFETADLLATALYRYDDFDAAADAASEVEPGPA